MHLRKRDGPSTTVPLPPRPCVVNASGTFDGNDGRWSSFIINVNSNLEGLEGQNFKTLISTSSSVTLLPARTEWCNKACAGRRGVLPYEESQPQGVGEKNWEMFGLYDIPLPYWYTSDLLKNSSDTPVRAVWGHSNVGLGESSADSLVLQNQFVAKHLFSDFFMGSFGLAAGEIGDNGTIKATFLSQFENDTIIASSSYGYSAGAYYRNSGGVLGSLVLGGYDKSRMTDKGVSLSMVSRSNTTLLVGVQSIIYTPDQNVANEFVSFTAKTGGRFIANIDSTLPYLILADNICDMFQEKFGLEYNESRNLYFVNSSSHEANKQRNAKVTFEIGPSSAHSGKSTNIELPYAAFDQYIGSETGENFRNYFPIKKTKSGISTLGRTFLQEAYLVIDYERANFTLAQAHWSDPMPKTDIQMILDTEYVPPGPSDTSSSGGGLAPGAIAGTVVGIVVAFVIAGIIAFCLWRKRKTKREAAHEQRETTQIDPILAGHEIKHRRVSELTGSDVPSSPKAAFGGYYTADHKSIPPISEMSPDSPPVELYSPPPESASDVNNGQDYFNAGKPHRRGAQRDRASSGHNSPGTPIAELAGEEISHSRYTVRCCKPAQQPAQ